MNKQSKKLNSLCLTGFVLSVLAPIVGSVGIFVVSNNRLWYRLRVFMSGSTLQTLFFCILFMAIAMAVLGFILSIKGVSTCSKRGEKGNGLGILGIVFSGMLLVTTSMILLFVMIIPRESPPKSTTSTVNEHITETEERR